MTHFGHNLPQKMFELITTAVSTLLLLVIFYILQYIFDMDFVCSCTTVTGMNIHPNGVLYLLVPPLILTWVVTLIESFHQRRIFTRWQRLCQNNGCCFLVKLVISYVSLTAVWVATVMFDGDWYFCLMTNRNASLTGIPCKDELSYEENLIKNAYKSTSLVSNNTQQSNIKPKQFYLLKNVVLCVRIIKYISLKVDPFLFFFRNMAFI